MFPIRIRIFVSFLTVNLRLVHTRYRDYIYLVQLSQHVVRGPARAIAILIVPEKTNSRPWTLFIYSALVDTRNLSPSATWPYPIKADAPRPDVPLRAPIPLFCPVP